MVKLTLVDGGEEWVNPADVTRVCKDTRVPSRSGWDGDRSYVYIRGEPTLVVKGTPEDVAGLLSGSATQIVVNVANADDPNRVAEAFNDVLRRVAEHRSKRPMIDPRGAPPPPSPAEG